MRKIIAAILAGAALLACKSHAQVSADLQNLFDDTLGSSNMVYAPFFERKLTGNADGAGMVGFFNFSDNVAAGGGFCKQWQPSGGQAPDTYSLSASIQLKDTLYPFQNFGFTNFSFTVLGSTAIGTPLNGDNNGNIMNVNIVGAVINLHTWQVGTKSVTVAVEGFYANQTGTGYYNGNWAGGGPAGGIEDGAPRVALKAGISF